MVSVPVQCPHCHSSEVIKAGKQANGTQRYQCQNGRCAWRIFLLHYQDRGRIPEVRRQVVDMATNGSGIRDTARVLRISPTTVIAVLKKSVPLRQACLMSLTEGPFNSTVLTTLEEKPSRTFSISSALPSKRSHSGEPA